MEWGGLGMELMTSCYTVTIRMILHWDGSHWHVPLMVSQATGVHNLQLLQRKGSCSGFEPWAVCLPDMRFLFRQSRIVAGVIHEKRKMHKTWALHRWFCGNGFADFHKNWCFGIWHLPYHLSCPTTGLYVIIMCYQQFTRFLHWYCDVGQVSKHGA